MAITTVKKIQDSTSRPTTREEARRITAKDLNLTITAVNETIDVVNAVTGGTGAVVCTDLTANGNVILGSDATDTVTINGTIVGASAMIFEGGTVDASETTLAVEDPTADRTITLPNITGTVVVTEGAQTINGVKTFGDDINFVKEENRVIEVAASTTAATAGANLTIRTGLGNGAESGRLTLQSATETGTDASGEAKLQTGNTASANSGGTTIASGNVSTLGNSGIVTVNTGSAVTGDSGEVNIKSGAVSTLGASGQLNIESGNSTISGDTGDIICKTGVATLGDSGRVALTTGNATTGSSGDVVITTGTASATRGNVTINTLQVKNADGLVGTPAYSFINNSDTGIYLVSVAQTGFSQDGALVGGFNGDGLFTGIISEQVATVGVTVDGVLLKDGAVTPDNGVVTQITDINTGVTLNKPAGVITTVSAPTAGLDADTFTVTNSFATTTSNIQCQIVDYAGTIITNGVPSVIVDNRTAGTFDIIVYNAHAVNALSGALQIAFVIFK